MSFQIKALEPARFLPFFSMSVGELAAHRAVRLTAETSCELPCRISLATAEIGDEVILLNYEHQQGISPFRASHAIYVREGVEQARPAIGEVPELFMSRMLSLRAFDDRAMIVAAELSEGRELAPALAELLAAPRAAYVHIHFAKYGCYAARADRA